MGWGERDRLLSPFGAVGALRWTEPSIHYRPYWLSTQLLIASWGDCERLHRACVRRKGLAVQEKAMVLGNERHEKEANQWKAPFES